MLEIIKVYGPYVRKKDNRAVVVLRLIDGSLTTQSYARYLYEQVNGKIGDVDLTVDHKDEDVTNDVLENLDLLTREENIRKSKRSIKMFSGICPICSKPFQKRYSYVINNLKRGSLGPFCSRRCAGVRTKS